MVSSKFLAGLTLASIAFADDCANVPAAPKMGSDKPVGQLPSWKVGAKWQVEIQNTLKLSSNLNDKLVPDADIWDIDLWQACNNKTVVDNLHKRQKTVICYFNFGAIQPYDCDFTTWLNKGLWNGPFYAEASPGQTYCERYDDVTNSTAFDLLKHRLDVAVAAGCDGVDPDNIDVWTVQQLGLSQQQVVAKLKEYADYAHSLKTKRGNPLMIGQKNAAAISNDLVDKFDFAVLENCLTDSQNACSKFSNYISKNKPVIAIEYPKSLVDNSKADSCNRAGINSGDRSTYCNSFSPKTPTGFSEILKLDADKNGLNGCYQYCEDKTASTSAVSSDDGKTCNYQFDQCCDDGDNEYKQNNCCDDAQCDGK